MIPYPAVERHGVIGDRRTAALVAADGTLDWLCLPDYDSPPICGALLDARRGGFWRVGPRPLRHGVQSYPGVAPILSTVWETAGYALELVDCMPCPAADGASAAAGERIVLRRLTCLRGRAACAVSWRPAHAFVPLDDTAASVPGVGRLTMWASRSEVQAESMVSLEAGERLWLALSTGGERAWSAELAERLLDETRAFWDAIVERLGGQALDPRLARSAVTIRLLEYAPCGSVVAAPTTSVPERIGGQWNADYRFTWVRDASLCMRSLARLGDLRSAARYLDWLAGLQASAPSGPLQVLYTVRGGRTPEQHEHPDLEGYRGSRPVRTGNHAFRQQQLDMYGYLADCMLIYLENGGQLRRPHWRLLAAAAAYVAAHWREPGNGIWELPLTQRYLSSRVMCWTALDRARRIAGLIGVEPAELDDWQQAQDAIREEVEHHGFHASVGAFTQALGSEALDASALLMPITGFLPVSDPRVARTIERIAQDLTIDGAVYRFDPARVGLSDAAPLGQFEGAFLPCTFWLAQVRMLQGRRDEAEALLAGAARAAGPLGLYAEALDPRTGGFAGNTPLLFSHVEHMEAVHLLTRDEQDHAFDERRRQPPGGSRRRSPRAAMS